MSRVQLRRDTTTRWGLANPVLALGEIGIDVTTKRFKIGDGIHNWTDLGYFVQFTSEKNQPGGYPGLDDNGKIPSGLIDFPEFPDVNSFEYFNTLDEFPETGQFQTLYLNGADRQFYVWGGETPAYQLASVPPVADTEVFGVLRLAGDLGGTAEVPRVTGINGVEVVGAPSGAGRVLKSIDATHASWQADAVGSGGGGGGGLDHYEEDIGDGTANPITVTHGMGTRQIVPSATRKGGDCEVISTFRLTAPSIHACILEPDMVLAPAAWRLTLIGSLGLSDVTKPTPPTVTATTHTTQTLGATAAGSTDDVAVAGFNWFIKPHADSGLPQYAGKTALGAYTFTGLNGATLYDIACTAFDAAGNESDMSTTAPGTTDAPVNVVRDAIGVGASRNQSAGSIKQSWLHTVHAGFARILLVAFDVTHINYLPWANYTTLKVTSSVDGALTKVPGSSINVYGSTAAAGSIHWFYKIAPTVGDHTIEIEWAKSTIWADGIRGQSYSAFNVDQVNPFHGAPVLIGETTASAALNATIPSMAGNMALAAVISNDGDMGTLNQTLIDVLGNTAQGAGDFLSVIEAPGAPSVSFTGTTSRVHAASVIDLQKVV